MRSFTWSPGGRGSCGLLTAVVLVAAVGVAELATAKGRIVDAERVVNARRVRGAAVKQLFLDKGLPYPAPQIYLRAFKREDQLELWAGKKGEPLVLIKTFAVCQKSGELGPKRRRGDLQVPEGFYLLTRYQPWSNFHLSLRVNYPNASDRVRGHPRDPGGDIYIHGDCVTIGCLPLEDGPIEELFLATLDTRNAGQRYIPIHIFPTRMDAEGMAHLEKRSAEGAPHLEFWKELKPAYDAFELTHKVPKTWIDKRGRYQIKVRQ